MPQLIALLLTTIAMTSGDDFTNVQIIDNLKDIVQKTPLFMEGDICRVEKVGDEVWVIASGYGVTSESGFAAKKDAQTVARLSCDTEMLGFLFGRTISDWEYLHEREFTKDDVTTFSSLFEKKTKAEVKGLLAGVRDGGSWQLESDGERVFFKLRYLPIPTANDDPPASAGETNTSESVSTSDQSGTSGGEKGIVVVVVGVSEYLGIGNESYSRREALEDALSEAVRQALGSVLKGETLVESGDVKLNRLYEALPEGSIRHEVLDSGIRGDDEYFVKISATVSPASLERTAEQVGLISSMIGKPKIAIIPLETINGHVMAYDSSPITNALSGMFIAAPYFLPVIDVAQVMVTKKAQQPELWKKYEAMRSGSGEMSVRDFGALGIAADVLMKGEVLLIDRGLNSDGVLNIYSGTATLKMVWAGTGERCAEPVTESVSAISDTREGALVVAIKKLMPRVNHQVESMLEQWQNRIKNGQQFTVTFSGIPLRRRGMQLKQAIRKGLEQLPKVKQVESGVTQDGFANYAVTFLGTSSMFKQLMEEWLLSSSDMEDWDFAVKGSGGSFMVPLTPF